MNVFSSAIIVTAIMVLTSCGSETSDKTSSPTADVSAETVGSMNDFEWLNGWWQNSLPEGIVFEQWTGTNGTLSGRGGFIKGTDTMIAETISLEQAGKDILYIPTVNGQNNGQPVPFKLTFASADSFVFQNPEHDFPTVITYHKLSENTMTARISGKINGEEQSEAFHLSRGQ
jgi:hypothetical protein